MIISFCNDASLELIEDQRDLKQGIERNQPDLACLISDVLPGVPGKIATVNCDLRG